MTLGELLGDKYNEFILREVNNVGKGYRICVDRTNNLATFMRFGEGFTETEPFWKGALDKASNWHNWSSWYTIEPILSHQVIIDEPIKCTCDIPVLMSVGCACGGFKSEMEFKRRKRNEQKISR